MLMMVLVLLAALIIAFACLYVYGYYHANKKSDNNPRRFLKYKGSRDADARVVVCVGDSITHGNVGENYVDILSRRLERKGFCFVNAGANSELAYNVLQRLDEIVACDPDFITILIGTNDSNKSLTDARARQAIRQMRLPQRPTAEWYHSNLVAICRMLKAKTRARIALLSLPVITEDTHHPGFRHSLPFIKIIAEVAEREEVEYLPLRERMTLFIEENPSHSACGPFEGRDYVTRKAFARHFYLKKSWNEIAAANGFGLLIDFVHLNTTGAEMAADLIEEFISRETETHAAAHSDDGDKAGESQPVKGRVE